MSLRKVLVLVILCSVVSAKGGGVISSKERPTRVQRLTDKHLSSVVAHVPLGVKHCAIIIPCHLVWSLCSTT